MITKRIKRSLPYASKLRTGSKTVLGCSQTGISQVHGSDLKALIETKLVSSLIILQIENHLKLVFKICRVSGHGFLRPATTGHFFHSAVDCR